MLDHLFLAKYDSIVVVFDFFPEDGGKEPFRFFPEIGGEVFFVPVPFVVEVTLVK